MALFGPAQLMSPQERAEAIRSGAMTAEDFQPTVNKPVASTGYDNRPSSAQEDLAKSMGITVDELKRRQALQLQQLMQKRGGKAGGGLIEGGLGRLAKLLNGTGPASKGMMDVVRDVPIHAGGPAVTARSFEDEDFAALLEQLHQFGKAKALPPDHSSIFSQMIDNAGDEVGAVTHVTLDKDGVPHAAMQVAPKGTAQDDADYLAYLVSLNGGKGAGTQAVEHLKNNSDAISTYPSHSALGFWDKQMTRDPRWDVKQGGLDDVNSLIWKRQNKAKGGVVGNRGRGLPSSDQSGLGALNLIKGLAGMMGSAGRGAVAATLGFPGDLTRMGYMLTGNEQPGKGGTLLPDTSDMRRKLPALPLDVRADTYDSLGGQIPLTPGQISKVGGLAGLGGAEALARAMNSDGALASMLTAGMRPMGAVKGKGGQWLAGSVEDALRGELRNAKNPAILAALQNAGVAPETLSASDSLDNWIKGPLTKYIKRDMGTPNDPIVKLADQGIKTGEPAYTANPSGPLMIRRTKAGMNPKGEAATDDGRASENTLDNLINAGTAGDLSRSAYKPMLEQNSWLSKVDPETPVYSVNKDNLTYESGFGHMLDEMYNALGTDLPEHLRIDPKALASGNFSVDAAVRRVHDINKWRADATTAANQARASNAATHLHKDYGDGYKWVELRAPGDFSKAAGTAAENAIPTNDARAYAEFVDKWRADKSAAHSQLKDALKYEGDTMGHCVGGYCDDVASGRSRIYSLRDAKGQPHVTVETAPHSQPSPQDYDLLEEQLGRVPTQKEVAAHIADRPPSIVQIKGKGNAKPHDDYIPYVQDFVKNGQWSDVGDFGNTDLIRHPKLGYLTKEEAAKLVEDPLQGDYMPPDGLDYANGGLVNNDVLALYGYN